MKTKDGWISGVDIVSAQSQDEIAKGESVEHMKTKDMEYSHASKATTRATASKARDI